MAGRRIYCDKTEIVVFLIGKKKVTDVRISYDQVKTIRLDNCKEFRWFRQVPSESITIQSPTLQKDAIFKKYEHKKFFEAYKDELRKFAKENRITLHDHL